ncbi:hypothetical protein ASPBRDRAFT_43065 [Aspergillus brasiliensis CBS 101740]|uniref:Uncharacterized protein n=1 Tax=Aspergillus brasiliensis (strain CBS 101740 / IMI 381727 / IBT 21946) TaxID=767769 RepID=A0A1L9UJ37_ASPBC|nr:hypothetical protein ASPBRDRAFT_43065 [Aspergillus brasiliensis CBS 101740]
MGHCLRVAGSPTEQRDGTYRALDYILHMTWIRVSVLLLCDLLWLLILFLVFACIAWEIGWAAGGICYDCYDMTDMFMIWDVGCLLMSMLR